MFWEDFRKLVTHPPKCLEGTKFPAFPKSLRVYHVLEGNLVTHKMSLQTVCVHLEVENEHAIVIVIKSE